jgi:hypothetical protein
MQLFGYVVSLCGFLSYNVVKATSEVKITSHSDTQSSAADEREMEAMLIRDDDWYSKQYAAKEPGR